MSANGQLVFTDVDKVTFKGVGNTSNAVIDTLTGKIGVGIDSPDANLHVVGNCYVSTNFELGGTMTMGTIELVVDDPRLELSAITATGNLTPHTIQFTNATTGIVATGNVHALKFIGDGSELTGISTSPTLQSVTDTGNVSSNTIQFTNTTTGLVATGNVHALKFIGDGSELTGITTSGGTGAITVPSGTTAQRPATGVNGMLRYNSTTGFIEGYTAAGWSPVAQPPTATSVSPTSVAIPDTATQVFTVSGTGFDTNLTLQLIGADGTEYSVFNTTYVSGLGATFKMGVLGATGGYDVAQRPYKVRIIGGSGLTTTLTTPVIAIIPPTITGLSPTTMALSAVASQVVTVTGTNISPGSTIQLEGVDGTLYSVFDATAPNATGTQVTFKLGTLGASGGFVVAQQPYKVKVSVSGISVTSTAAIGFPVTWTSPAAGAVLSFDPTTTATQTLVGTDGGGGTNRTFSVAPSSAALPSGLTLTGSTGVITGQITGSTTSVTFRLTDNTTQEFTDRAINIQATSALYTFSPNPFTFTTAGLYGRTGPTLSQLTTAYSQLATPPAWASNTNYFNMSGFNGVQEWTVPKTTTYSISAYGAGSRAVNQGGYGARINGTCTLTKGEVIRILVGQQVATGTNSNGHGGAGGTFVVRTPYNTNASIIVIAGGGGGGHNQGTDANGNASLTTSGNVGNNNVAGGTAGGAGTMGYGDNQGAGFFGSTPTAGSFTTGGLGGYRYAGNVIGEGGFGAGGRHGTTHGGGGGGYSGGGGSNAGPYVGGGGGSYKATFFTVTSEDNTVHDGPGSVTITQL